MSSDECSERTVFDGPPRQGVLNQRDPGRFQSRLSMQCTSAASNMRSAWQLIDVYIAAEVRAGRVLGPMEPGNHPRVHVNRFGLVLKSHQPGKWRLINLSHPHVNDEVESELCSMNYNSGDVAVKRVLALGEGAKFDVEGAYRTVPVHSGDRWLLGMTSCT